MIVIDEKRIFKEITDKNPGSVSLNGPDGILPQVQETAKRITEKFERIPRTLGYYWTAGENINNPRRVLESLDVIEERYSSEFAGIDKDIGISWLAYARGRAHYQLESYTDAKKYLEMVSQRQPSLLIFIKTYWMLCLIKIYKFMHRV